MIHRTCDVDGCGRKHKGRGLCDKHLQRQRRTGTTDDPVKTLAERFWAKVDKDGPVPAHAPELGPCWVWTAAVNEHGYGVMRPEGQRTGPTVKAHRVALIIDGRDPGKLHVLHSCDNPPCVNAKHLRAGTNQQNADEMVAHDRHARGMRSGTRKLDDDAVREIRRRAAAGELHREIAASFGVARVTVTNVCNGKTWAHLNAVTPPCAEVIMSALVEAITGEDVAS